MKYLFFILLFICSIHCSYAQDSGGDTVAYRGNIISVSPFLFTENGLGFGGSYERSVDKKGLFAITIPVMVTFDVANSNRIYDYNTGNYKTGKADAMFYVMPGIKYYPTGSNGKLKYATGAALVLGSGKKSRDLLNLYGLNETEQVQSHFIAGIIWQNSLNLSLGKHLYISIDAGIGGSFFSRTGGVNTANEMLVRGGFSVGKRF